MRYRWREPRANLNVEINGEPFIPGCTLLVDIAMQPEENFRVREGRIDLTCKETYYVNDYAGEHASVRKVISQPFDISQMFCGEMEFSATTPYETRVMLKVPDEARPTIKGEDVTIEWHLKIFLDVAGGLDIIYEREIQALFPWLCCIQEWNHLRVYKGHRYPWSVHPHMNNVV